MSGIDVAAVVSFVVLILAWAVLPSSSTSLESKIETASTTVLAAATES